jgi:hypothetical protein
MKNVELPYFGQIDFAQLNEYYSAETKYNGQTLRLDLNFENKNLRDEEGEDIKKFLDNILAIDIKNKIEIAKDYTNEGETKDYINFYFDELDEQELSGIVDNQNLIKPIEEQLLNKLRLIRVGLYPDGKYDAEYYGVFDYSIDIDGEPCNQLLVVKTNKTSDLDHITWES